MVTPEERARATNRERIFAAEAAHLRDLALWLNAADPNLVMVALDDTEDES